MARIRTIKPNFFRHLDLYKAEIEENLPLRVAFAGLWTTSDREGRFKWRPDELKLDCLPYDKCDFSRVLDVLRTRGFIVKYESEGRLFGFIPSWKEHQHINNRELASILPDPCESTILTCEDRVDDACSSLEKLAQGEGKGKGKEGKENIYTRHIFDFWNQQEIIQHQCLTRDDCSAVSSALSKIKESGASGDDEAMAIINQAISDYAFVLKSKDHFFSHKWTFRAFLSQKNALEKFLANADPKTNFLRKDIRDSIGQESSWEDWVRKKSQEEKQHAS